jgi:protein-S-isoprenylcysteine O-methyltransferase Ste14
MQTLHGMGSLVALFVREWKSLQTNSEKQPLKMTRWGIGPIYAAASLVSVFILSKINISVLPALIMPYNLFVFVLGIGLITAGVLILIIALVQVHSAFSSRKLVTSGVYAYMRDPVYAVWILFIVPGFILITRMLLLTIVPFITYSLLKALIGREEAYMELTFGKEYLDYKTKVNSVIPKFRRSKTRSLK